MHYLIECDSFEINSLNQWLSNADQSNTFFILHKNNTSSKFESLIVRENVINIVYQDIFSYPIIDNLTIDYEVFWSRYYKDGIPFFLADRDGYFPEYGLGNHNAMNYYFSLIPRIISFFEAQKIDVIYFRNTPHHSVEWLVATCAEYRNLDVYVSQRHILPWRYSLAKGFGRDRKLVEVESEAELDKTHIKRFVSKLKGDHENAKPGIEKRRNPNLKNLVSPWRQWREMIFKPHKFWAKKSCYDRYKRSSVQVKDGLKYFFFALHVQPERTSMPEGFGFQNQVLILQTVQQYLPPDVKIVIKEHPSTFTLDWSHKHRNKKFYDLITSMPNVILSDLASDTFGLVDKAMAVITITGNIGVESFVRGKPVIYFGLSQLRVKGVHVYRSHSELKSYIEGVVEGKISAEEDVLGALSNSLENSVSGLLEGEHIYDYYEFADFQERAHFKLLSELVKKVENVS